MVRVSKQEEHRNRSPRKKRPASIKTGSKEDNLPKGYKEHTNAMEGDLSRQFFIGKVR